LNSRARVFGQAVKNLNDGFSALSIADQAIARLSEIVTRQKELAEQSANGIYSSAQRTVIDNEAQTLSSEYRRILESTEFNGIKLIDGSKSDIRLQGGYGTNGIIDAEILQKNILSSGSTVDAGTTTNTSFNFLGTGSELDHAVLVGDMNNDGRDDIVSLRTSNKAGDLKLSIEVRLGQSDKTFTLAVSQVLTVFPAGSNPSYANIKAKLEDSDSDGDLDLVMTIDRDLLGFPAQENETFENKLVPSGTFGLNLSFNDNNGTAVDNSLHNGTLLDVGDFNGDGFTDDITVSGSTVTAKVTDTTVTTSETVLIEDLSQSSFSLLTQNSSLSALDSLSTLLDKLSRARGKIGASQGRLNVATNVLKVTRENSLSAASRITSADIAQETAELTRSSILQQTAAAIMAQANSQASIVLDLLRI
ncbi:MAG: hypothetical protein D6719_09860, partial [Candidatus Dadabacteria bacterium]